MQSWTLYVDQVCVFCSALKAVTMEYVIEQCGALIDWETIVALLITTAGQAESQGEGLAVYIGPVPGDGTPQTGPRLVLQASLCCHWIRVFLDF